MKSLGAVLDKTWVGVADSSWPLGRAITNQEPGTYRRAGAMGGGRTARQEGATQLVQAGKMEAALVRSSSSGSFSRAYLSLFCVAPAGWR
ncbi:uncharacterized protein SPSK_05708 [Sporothrix schenckii 1099-18]|uniref:Uncharacterized protein n=1 Tax=Sporothrix schenckii 1099-18 TaxID=1397361 RepID=A0A0F2LX47_SPOSC|nr:uncharacterized protein SPSK_05708 [Sporothrix schenckii 1099-18]KJR81070.1 hypothetical protein SPSK_05708 [Sporothrix schenckii 1099-18]